MEQETSLTGKYWQKQGKTPYIVVIRSPDLQLMEKGRIGHLIASLCFLPHSGSPSWWDTSFTILLPHTPPNLALLWTAHSSKQPTPPHGTLLWTAKVSEPHPSLFEATIPSPKSIRRCLRPSWRRGNGSFGVLLLDGMRDRSFCVEKCSQCEPMNALD